MIALAAVAGRANVFTTIALFFSKMALVTFGGAYAVLAYVAQKAVSDYHWVSPGEMLDGLGMAETTPGPLIMVLTFVGFLAASRAPEMLPPLLAGALGGLLATWVTFTPCILWIFVGAPYIEQLRGNKPLSGALSAITAAVVGVVLNLAIWFAVHTVFRGTLRIGSFGLSFDAPIPASLDVWSSHPCARRGDCDLPLQGRNDFGSRGQLRCRHRFLCRGGGDGDALNPAFRYSTQAKQEVQNDEQELSHRYGIRGFSGCSQFFRSGRGRR